MNSPALLIAIPLLVAFLSVMFKRLEKALLGIAILANLAVTTLLALNFTDTVIYHIGNFRPPFGISLVLDNYSLFGIVLVNIIFALALILGDKFINKHSVVLSISLAALNGLVLSGDLFNLFVFLEIGAIAAYILTSMNNKFKYSFNYLVIGTLGSGLYLFGVIIMYNIFGTLNIFDINSKILVSSNINPAIFVLPMVMIFTGLAVEAKLLPFNGWVKGILGNANGLVGPIIASGYATAIILVFGRLINNVFILSEELKTIFIVVSVLTLILAEIAAYSKKNLREILLFSSIAQSGLVVTLFLYNLTFVALLVLLNNVISKLIMFSIAGKIAEEHGSDNIYDIKGIFAKYKLIGFGFTAASMSIIGLPLFYGFTAKLNVLLSLIKANNLWLPAIILLLSVIEGAYFIRILTNLWNPGEEGTLAHTDNCKEIKLFNVNKVGIIVALIGLIIIISGIVPFVNLNEINNNIAPAFISNLIGGV